MPGAQSLFSNSKNPNFIGCNFNAVNGDYHYHINKNQSGLNTLSKVISVGAIHDSSEHSPKCHPETRKDVLKLILDWIDDPSPPCSVLWLYGPAGAGKTAILQSIAELLNAHQEVPTESIRQCGGSFFFSRGKQGRDEGHQLFPTIGYQLALNLPSLSVHVNKIMESNPILHTKTMDVQLNSLIVDAFHKLKQEGTDFLHTPTVIIDGLDECRGNETQQNILALISQAVVDKKIPLRFLIASRPEAHIRESFDQSNLHTITRRVVLDDSFNPKKDIELFLREGFADISRNHPLKSYTWPGDGIISLLVQKSSGQFIYAATILKFVGSEDSESSSPMKQLNIVLAPNPAAYSNEAFSDLDLLYTQILSACRNPMGVVRVLGVILVLHCYQPPEVIEDILAMEQGEVTLVLRSLHSLIYFPGTKGERYELKEHGSRNSGADGFQLLHESFRDYLVDHRRSGQFFVNIVEAHSKLTVAGFKLMTRWIHYPRFGLQSKQPPCLKTWGYLKWHLAPHFSICPSDVRAAIIEDLKAFQQDFSENKAKRQNKANYQIHFDALHCAMTVLVHLMFNKWHYREGLCHRSHNASQDCTVIDILDECPQALEDVKYATIYYQYRSILDDCYTSFTAHDGADINGLIHLIKSIPGFLVQRTMMPVKAVADLCSVDLEFAKDLLERNEQFVDRLDTYQRPSDVGPHLSGICLNRHMSQFLLDKSRSGPYHIRPSSHHVVICFHALSIFYDLNWSRLSNLDENVVTYLGNNFQQHLYGLDIRVEELVKKHPTSRFLDQLDNIIYYSPDMRDAPPANLAYIWHATNCILRWLQSQQVLDSDCGLQERLRRIADRIYAQILCVELRSIGSADGEENVGIITLCPPFLARVKDFIANVENTHSELEPIAFQKFDVDTVIPGKLEISDDFLLLPDIIPSLTEYLTDIKRAGRLYISPNTYHTQLAEYCLEMYPGQDWPSEQSDDDFCIMKRLEAERNWKFHLVRALPSERIFARLRVIRLSGPSMESFKDIIKWLEGLPEPPLDVYIRWQVEILKKDSEPLPVYPIWREEVTFRRQMDYYDYYVMWTEKLVEIKYGWILDFIFIGFFFRLCMYMFKFQL